MKYRTVVIDFPWPIEGIGASAAKKMHYGRRLIPPYKMMTLKEISTFPINDYADENCALFLWAPQAFVKTAMDLAEQWGFKQSKLITWNKNDGINWLGFWNNGEFVVFAYRGKYPIPLKARGTIPCVFEEKAGRHSEKPRKFYQMLLPLLPAPRIDIFARRRHYGFDAWGDQAQEQPITIETFAPVEVPK